MIIFIILSLISNMLSQNTTALFISSTAKFSSSNMGFELNNYFSNLKFNTLDIIENYKKTFDYWENNRVIDKQNKFNLPETSIPYFSGSILDKMNFLKKNLFINDVSDNLVDLIEIFLSYYYNQGGSERLKSCKAIWKNNDLEILYNPNIDCINVVG